MRTACQRVTENYDSYELSWSSDHTQLIAVEHWNAQGRLRMVPGG